MLCGLNHRGCWSSRGSGSCRCGGSPLALSCDFPTSRMNEIVPHHRYSYSLSCIWKRNHPLTDFQSLPCLTLQLCPSAVFQARQRKELSLGEVVFQTQNRTGGLKGMFKHVAAQWKQLVTTLRAACLYDAPRV